MPANHKKPNICFYALFEWANIFFQISRKLEGEVEPFFITPTSQVRDRLLSWGVAPEKILDISKTHNEIQRLGPPSAQLLEQTAVYEQYGPTIPSLLLMSRFYKPSLYPEYTHYLCQTAQQMDSFLSSNKIDWVFAEPCNGPDILSFSVAAKLGIKAGDITSVRYPGTNHAVFSDIYDSNLHPLAPAANPPTLEQALSYVREYAAKSERPFYAASQERARSLCSLLKSLTSRLRYVCKEAVGSGQINYADTLGQLEIHSRRFYAGLRKYDKTFKAEKGFSDGRPYAAYFLQVEPERSTAVFAPFHCNQFEIITALRRSLPSKYHLVIKDHPSSFGIQPFEFYRKLKTLPDVSLVSGREHTASILKGAKFVSTISGTVAMESAFHGVPSIIFCKTFFQDMPGVLYCESLPALPDFVQKALELRKTGSRNENALAEFMLGVMRNSGHSSWDSCGRDLDENELSSMSELVLRAIKFEEEQE